MRLQAVAVLEELRSPLAIPVLEGLLSTDESGVFAEPDAQVRELAAAALTSLRRFSSSMQALQTIFIGLSLGSILVLMSLGLAIIYGQMGVINMAHGEFMMIGAYTTFVVAKPVLGCAAAGVRRSLFRHLLSACFPSRWWRRIPVGGVDYMPAIQPTLRKPAGHLGPQSGADSSGAQHLWRSDGGEVAAASKRRLGDGTPSGVAL